ncbi:phospholipase D-like domain-containing protein [Paludibacterium paludis]|uniref:Phospholipase n=1 Tax=Paludibacterium paludis TaxID=1225769 RepID=A0A918UBP6_9NEIS|nr:phospholipase D-like domain-containing protein [Paludibacterium paludis]GGY25884.1 phospholipase [Paludibacterium paludis]
MRQMLRSALCLALFGLSPLTARAEFTVPGFELVYTAPAGAGLEAPDLRSPSEVWSGMVDAARSDIAIGAFYVNSRSGTALDRVIGRLEAAGRRGVKIRFLMEEKGRFAADEATIARLRAIPNLEFRFLDFGKLGGGIVHAKYLIVDKQVAYVGSQNFDWRSLEHIHETGLKITEPFIVSRLSAIFGLDWQAQAAIASGRTVAPLNTTVKHANLSGEAFLVASPNAFNPPGVGDSETALPALIGQARSEVRIQLLDYVPLAFGDGKRRAYYAVIDNAIRAALARGVKVKLMVSDWNAVKPDIDYLKSLAVLPGMEVRIVTVPPVREGCIPFARVIHSKTMTIDGKLAWIGTSNWSGGYMDTSRNLEVVVRNASLAGRVAALHEAAWSSLMARPVRAGEEYAVPDKACLKTPPAR